MKIKYYIADVFTKQLFNGAQIAVIPNADGLSETTMKLLARELNLSETVFVFHPESAGNTRKMRIFTPKKELDFAGHPIIATAFVLGVCGDLDLSQAITPIILEQNAGLVEANITAHKGKPIFVQFTRKVTSIIDRFTPTDEELSSFLGIKQTELIIRNIHHD